MGNDTDDIDGPAHLTAIERAVGGLPLRLRAVLIEVHSRDRSVAEAARALGVSPATVPARLHEALRKLRKVLDDQDARIGQA